jgi:Bacterial PH domain
MILFGVLLVVLFVIRTGVWITETGIRVRNPISSYELSWSQIKGFRIGRHGVLPKALLIDTDGGDTRYAFAVQVANLSLRNPERGFVANLNHALTAQRISDA